MKETDAEKRIQEWAAASRLTIIVGHFGTGKTEVAVNLALMLGEMGLPFTLADLDVVDPYFRSRECAGQILQAGGRLITSSQACMDADVPSMPADVASVFDDKDRYAVMDIGGDASGARVLAQYRHRIEQSAGIAEHDLKAPAEQTVNDTAEAGDLPAKEPGSMRVLAVLNANRPMTPDADSMVSYIRSIEEASGLKITGLINNTHLCGETTEEDIIRGADMAREVASKTGIPLAAHTIDRKLLERLTEETCGEAVSERLHVAEGELIVPIDLYMKKPWEV